MSEIASKAKTPPEGKCERCTQCRPLFVYKPMHDCVTDAGTMNLIDAARYIAEIEDMGDVWCTRRIENLITKPWLCVRCHDTEADREQKFIDHELS